MKCNGCNKEFKENKLKNVLKTVGVKNKYFNFCKECYKKFLNDEIQLEDKYFEFLDRLRNSGVTNMFGAAPYLISHFGIPQNLAKLILLDWMKTFDERLKKGEVSTKTLKVETITLIDYE